MLYNNVKGDNDKDLRMTVDNTKMLITISTHRIVETTEDIPFSKKGNYFIYNDAPLDNAPLGELLFSFINWNFETRDGFEDFVKLWGLPGFLDFGGHTNLDYTRGDYSPKEYKDMIKELYNICKKELLTAQKKFKTITNYCINSHKEIYFKDITPLQRYYIGETKEELPSIDDYSSKFHVLYMPYRNYENCSNFIEGLRAEVMSSREDLCKIVKSDSLNILQQYYTRNIISLVYVEFFNLLNNFSIAKCGNCGKYFVPKTKITEVYCEDCRHIGYINKIKTDEFLRAYNTAYKTKHAQKQRKTRGKSIETHNKYESALKQWREEAKNKLELIQQGKITENEFKQYLNKDLEV